MEKRKGKPDDSLGNIYITYDAEMGQNDPTFLGSADLESAANKSEEKIGGLQIPRF